MDELVTPERLLAAGRLETYPTRAAWRADRRSGPPDYALGGTDVAAILGKGYRSAWDIYSAAHEAPEEDADNAVLRRGRALEPVILDEYLVEHDGVAVCDLMRVVHPRYPWLRPSPDALVRLTRHAEPDAEGGWEGKTAAWDDGWGEDGAVCARWDEEAMLAVPAGYAIQVYVLLDATELPWWDVTVAIPMRGKFLDYRTIRLMRDEETQGAIVEAVAEWRERHLVGGEPPPLDATQACGQALARRFAGGAKTKRPATAEEAGMVAEYAALGREGDEIEERRKLLSHQLQEAIGADYGGLLLGPGDDGKPATASVVRSSGRRSVALSRVEKERPELAAALDVAGLITTGAPSAHIRTHGC